MFKYILGIIIDTNGYYLSFGKYTTEFTNYFSLHGRSFLSSLLVSNWVNTHKDISWKEKDIKKIVHKDIFEVMDFDSLAFSYFEELSRLGYAILLNGTYEESDPMTYGYIPSNLTYPQIMTLLYLRSDILYCPNIESDFSIIGKDEMLISIYEWYQELEEKGMQRILANQL